jgi:hypothetical protein
MSLVLMRVRLYSLILRWFNSLSHERRTKFCEIANRTITRLQNYIALKGRGYPWSYAGSVFYIKLPIEIAPVTNGEFWFIGKAFVIGDFSYAEQLFLYSLASYGPEPGEVITENHPFVTRFLNEFKAPLRALEQQIAEG